ncbi:hypothetical protein Tco_0090479 [Tanacetum coccineum]
MGAGEKKPALLPATARGYGDTNVANAQRAIWQFQGEMVVFECGHQDISRRLSKINKDVENGNAQAGIALEISLIDIALTPLENSYVVELADEKIVMIDVRTPRRFLRRWILRHNRRITSSTFPKMKKSSRKTLRKDPEEEIGRIG